MNLVLINYLDRSPDHVKDHVAATIPQAMRAAAERISQDSTSASSSVDHDHAVVHGGLDVLDGAAIQWDGVDDLTMMRVTVPWSPDVERRGRTVLAANRFAQVLASGVRDAA